MQHRIVFLDRSSLQAEVRRPSFAHDWQEYPASEVSELPEKLRDATVAITNKVPVTPVRGAGQPQGAFRLGLGGGRGGEKFQQMGDSALVFQFLEKTQAFAIENIRGAEIPLLPGQTSQIRQRSGNAPAIVQFAKLGHALLAQ